MDKQALRDTVSAFERRYGGHHGTGFQRVCRVVGWLGGELGLRFGRALLML